MLPHSFDSSNDLIPRRTDFESQRAHPAKRLDAKAWSRLPWLLTVAVLLSLGSQVEAQTIRDDFYVTDGQVRAMAVSGDTLYIGGDFSRVGPSSGKTGSIPFDAVTGAMVGGFPQVVGYVYAITPDGSGGWYIGGNFAAVGGMPRTSIAHILSDSGCWILCPEGRQPIERYSWLASSSMPTPA